MNVTLSPDPGGSPTVTFQVDGLGISESATASAGTAIFTISTVVADNSTIWDATLQVDSNTAVEAAVQVVETNDAQDIGVTLSSTDVTYCSPLSGGGVTSLIAGSVIAVDQATGAVTVSHGAKAATGTALPWPSSITIDAYGHVVASGLSQPPAVAASNLSDLADDATARTNLGLTAAASTAIGTTAGDLIVLDGAAKLPAVDGSQLTNLPSGGSTDWKRDPTSTTVKLFQDFYSPSFDISYTSWYGFLQAGTSGSSLIGVTRSGAEGAALAAVDGSSDLANLWGPRLFDGDDLVSGMEYLFEARIQVDWGASTGTLGAISGFMQDNDAFSANTSPPGDRYTSARCAGLHLQQEETYVQKFIKDTTGADTPTQTDTTKTTASADGVWIRIAHHAVWNSGTSVWDITHYVDGVSVATNTLQNDSGRALMGYVSSTGGGGTNSGTCNVYFDWIALQYKKVVANTYLDIEDV